VQPFFDKTTSVAIFLDRYIQDSGQSMYAFRKYTLIFPVKFNFFNIMSTQEKEEL